MLANSREELVEVFDALDAELDRLDEVSFEVLTTPERLRSLERLECLVRRLPAVGAHVDQPTRHPSQRGRTGRHAVLRAGQPVTHHQARRRPTHRRRRRSRTSSSTHRRTASPTVDRHRHRPTPGPDRRGAHQSDSRPFSPTCPPRWMCPPARPPKPTWPAKPLNIVPTSWPATPSGSWTGYTPTATSPTPNAPANAASP